MLKTIVKISVCLEAVTAGYTRRKHHHLNFLETGILHSYLGRFSINISMSRLQKLSSDYNLRDKFTSFPTKRSLIDTT